MTKKNPAPLCGKLVQDMYSVANGQSVEDMRKLVDD
jgi:hypothetical protein